MVIQLQKRLKESLNGRFGKYQFQVGVLEDAPHKDALKGKRGLKGLDVITTYAGGPRRKVSRKSSTTISQVSKSNRKRLGFNYLKKPFEKKSSDIVKFANEFFRLAFGRSQKRRAENLLQAIVRNPILRGEYKGESAITKAIKGFSRPMIDTAQLFKALRADCKVKTSFLGGYK